MSIVHNHSRFPLQKFNRMIEGYISNGYPDWLQPAGNYLEFTDRYPVIGKTDLALESEQLLDAGKLRSCYIIASSGSTSGPTILASRFTYSATDQSYPYQVREAMERHVFSSSDIVANLLTAGCLGNNYEGMCRLLEPIGVTILPVGRPDVMNNDALLLELLQRFAVNVLVGSPSGIVQLAQAAQKAQVTLQVRKIVFVGEAFHEVKRKFVLQQWPKAHFYSLYGATELGFAAINTPAMPAGQHLLLSDWFFVEISQQGEVLVTDLRSPMVPLIRYRIGDYGALSYLEDTDEYYLSIGARIADEFSLGGHRIRLEQIRERLAAGGIDSALCQVLLRSTEHGRDCVQVAVDIAPESFCKATSQRLEVMLESIPRLGEALRRDVAELKVVDRGHFHYNSRQKLPGVRDERDTVSTCE